ncbi:MAG TPA: hypothetical protein VIY48_06330 [Candidatus Paceibacterota bacterium]
MFRFIATVILFAPMLTGCLGSTYILGDLRSGQSINLQHYSIVVPVLPTHEDGVWERTSKSLESDDLLLRSRWMFSEPGKIPIYRARVAIADTRSSLKNITDLKKHVEDGGLEGIHFSNAAQVETTQDNLLCVRPPLYSEAYPEEGSAHFVFIMACLDTRTQLYYELFMTEDVLNEDKTTPGPSDGLSVGASQFFGSFRVK